MLFKYREIERNLKKMGFQVVRQKGSHVIFSNGRHTFPVPNISRSGTSVVKNSVNDKRGI